MFCLYATILPAHRAPVASPQSFHCHPDVFNLFSSLNFFNGMNQKSFHFKSYRPIQTTLAYLHREGQPNSTQDSKGDRKDSGEVIKGAGEKSGLSCLKNVINVAVHSQAPEINMYSTTLISPYYALNYGPWLSQALLICEIHKLVKSL